MSKKKISGETVEVVFGLQRQVKQLADLNHKKKVWAEKLQEITEKVEEIETSITSQVDIDLKELQEMVTGQAEEKRRGEPGMDTHGLVYWPEWKKVRHTPIQKKELLLEVLLSYWAKIIEKMKKRAPASDRKSLWDEVPLSWITRTFESLTGRTITNVTMYFANVIDKDWYIPQSNTRNRAIYYGKATEGLKEELRELCGDLKTGRPDYFDLAEK